MEVVKAQGIKETKEVLVAMFKLGGAIKTSLADGKMDFSDAGNFLTLIPTLGAAVSDISLVPTEIKDLDGEEMAELESMLVKEVGTLLNKEKLIEQINKGLKVAHAMYDFYKTF